MGNRRVICGNRFLIGVFDDENLRFRAHVEALPGRRSIVRACSQAFAKNWALAAGLERDASTHCLGHTKSVRLAG